MSASACDTVRSHLPLFAGGDLDTADAETVRVHLIACVACRNEASGLQRALAGLRSFGSQQVPGVDEAWFAAQQRAICECVEAVPAPVGGGAGRADWRPWVLAAAALLLVGLGFVLGQGGLTSSVFTRPATAIGFGDPKAVPYSGPRAPLRQLGDDERSGDDREGAPAAGMRGREELRTLVDDGLVLPPRKSRQRVPR